MHTPFDRVDVEADPTRELDWGHPDSDEICPIARVLTPDLEEGVDDAALLVAEQHVLDLILSLTHSTDELSHQAEGELRMTPDQRVEGLSLETENSAVGEGNGCARTATWTEECRLSEEIARTKNDEIALDESDSLDEPNPAFLEHINVLGWFVLAIDDLTSRKSPAVGFDQSLALDVV